ncbi:MAG TPA: sigma-70 family RNA polymerase sigma factor [Tepidisphaeraceae bacterium]|nr:sigma-70 family RNA polymerase sigma factor [Tepidisphaeraceae bacterium]
MQQKDPNDDAAIIHQVLVGYLQSFAILVDRYQHPIQCMAANLLRPGDSAEDLAQEVFLAAYRNLHTFDSNRAAFSTWLLTICKNKCLAELRRKPSASLEQIAEPSNTLRPWDPLCQEELMARLDGALAALPFDQRLAFVLAELMDISCEQIAEIEQTPASTIRSRLTRARQALRLALKEFAGDTP